MTIDGNHITADNGKAIRRKGDTTAATATEAWLAANDGAENWEEVEYGYVETRYSVRAIIRELKAVGKFAAVRQMLESANFDWDFIGSNYLSTNDADFTAMLTAIVTGGILSQAELDALLPKCIWEQTPLT